MNRILNRANKRISLVNAATLLVVATLFGQLLGFIRTQLVNANFDVYGPNSTDAYFAAFKIPDFFFFAIAAGALGVAFMPYISDKLQKGDKKAVWELTSSLINLMAVIMIGVGVLLLVFAEPLIKLLMGSDLNPQQLHNATTIMRFIALNPLLFTISGILTSVQQTYGRFFFFALSPIIYNLSIIASVYIFKDLTGLGLGAMIGAVLQLVVVCLGLYGLGFKYYPSIRWKSRDFRGILRAIPPRAVDQGIDSINTIYETNRAANLGVGNVTHYENAYILHTAPIYLVGNSIATAAFPRLTSRLSQGRPDLFRKDFTRILRAMIWIIIPIVVISYFARGYLARMIFKNAAPEIALVFGLFAAAIFFRTIYTLVSRYFYAYKDTRTPLYVSLFAIALNIVLAYSLARPDAYAVGGLAMAQSVVAAVEVGLLMLIIIVKDPRVFDREFWGGILKMLSVTGFTVLTALIMITIVPLSVFDRGFTTLGTKFFFIAMPVLLVHLAISSLFGLEEAQPVINKIRKIILKPIKIQ